MKADPDQQPLGPSPVAMAPEELRRVARRAVEIAVAYLEELATRPAYRPMTEAQRLELSRLEIPDDGRTPDEILTFLAERILPWTFGSHPRFFGWVVPSSAPMGAIADFLAAVCNANLGGGRESPAIHLEMASVDALKRLVGFPVGNSAGLLVSGGSVANLTALAAARTWADAALGHDTRRHGVASERPRVAYTSEEAHVSVPRAVEILGLGSANLRTLPTNARFQLDPDAVRRAIATDRAQGREPFCVVAALGTVGAGTVDPLPELAELCREERLWLHVDGAYGAFGLLAPRYHALRDTIGRVDSLALDPHKFLAVPFECGAVLVKEGRILHDAFRVAPAYMHHDARGVPASPMPYHEYGVQGSRAFRALKLWAVLQQLGVSGATRLAQRYLRTAELFARAVEAHGEMELLAPVDLSIVCFRYRPAALAGDEPRIDRLNREILWRTQLDGTFLLSSTVLQGRFALRACFVNHWTEERDLAPILDLISRIGGDLARGPTP